MVRSRCTLTSALTINRRLELLLVSQPPPSTLISSKQADSQLSVNVYFIHIPLSGYLLSMNEVEALGFGAAASRPPLQVLGIECLCEIKKFRLISFSFP